MRSLFIVSLLATLPLAGCLPDQLSEQAIEDRIAAATLGNDCVAIVSCLHDCKGEGSCENACRAESGTEALSAVDALVGCEKSCADAKKTVAGSQCAQDPGGKSCRGTCQINDCLKESLACSDNGTEGDQDCMSGSACLDGCSTSSGDTLSCIASCGRALTRTDATALGKMQTCYVTAGAAVAGKPEKQAIQELISACAGETAACYTSGASGGQLCHEGLACVDLCGGKSDITACYSQCAAALTVTAQSDFVSFLYCAEYISDAGQFFEDCSWALIDCAAPAPSGKTCDGLLPAFQTCMTTDAPGKTLTCLGQALHQARPKHAQYFIDFNVCLAEKCGDKCKPGTPQVLCSTCLKTQCKDEHANCGGK